MTINFNVTGSERKRLVKALGEITFSDPVYAGAPSFAYTVGDYTVDKNGGISYPETVAQEAVVLIVEKLKEQGFTPEQTEDEAPADVAAETPDVAPEAESANQPEETATEATEGAETPDVAIPEAATTETEEVAEESESVPAESEDNESVSAGDDTHLTVSLPRKDFPDDAVERLKMIVANKQPLFKRALKVDELPVEVTEDALSFPWFTLTGLDGEAEAYAQFVTALCQMAKEQTRILDKPYDGDNDRFAIRIFMVRLGMKGAQYALARKLMMKNLSGNSGWRYGTPPKKEAEVDSEVTA